MKSFVVILAVVLGMPFRLFGGEIEDLYAALVTENGATAIIAATNDTNRADRVEVLRGVVTGLYATPTDLNWQIKLTNSFQALAEIDLGGGSASAVGSYVDLVTLDSELRGLALFAYGKLAQRASGQQAMITSVRPYLEASESSISREARSSIAATNTAEAFSILQALLEAHRSALPAPGFVVTEQNGEDIELRFGAVIMDAEALNRMQRPEAKAKAQETLTFLRNTYPSGPATKAVQHLEQQLARP